MPAAEPSRASQDADHGHRHPGGRAGRTGERQGGATQHSGRPAHRPAQGWRVHERTLDDVTAVTPNIFRTMAYVT